MYPPPVIVPPVPADDPSCGVPSDHSTAVATPLSSSSLGQNTNEYSERVFRPLPESGISEFGQWLTKEKWGNICTEDSPNIQVAALQANLSKKFDAIFPCKKVKISIKDRANISYEIKKLDRPKRCEYMANHRSD